jgi:dinuclear metal center YbgI/SA1388 family protein
VRTPTVAEVVAAVEARYPPESAEGWDAVGLVCGDPAAPVERVLLAVDPVASVVAEAVEHGAGLLLVHHPLLLRPVHGVAATTPKGRAVHDLVRAGCALHVAHTNADSARPGVSDAFADALGLRDLVPLSAAPSPPTDKVVVFVPEADAERVLDAAAAAGAGRIGGYERCAFAAPGRGTFTAGSATSPAVGRAGERTDVEELRLEVVAPRAAREAVLAAVRAAHPYEEPAVDVVELAPWASATGLGRVGVLPQPLPLRAFAEQVAARLPATVQGVRVAGPPGATVRRVAVCGGSGDTLFGAVRACGADAFVTADLRHHPASEARESAGDGPPYLLDVAHWASEWPWLQRAADLLVADLRARGATVDCRVSTRRTDPWDLHVPSAARHEQQQPHEPPQPGGHDR